jgi:hypothetical protein
MHKQRIDVGHCRAARSEICYDRLSDRHEYSVDIAGYRHGLGDLGLLARRDIAASGKAGEQKHREVALHLMLRNF